MPEGLEAEIWCRAAQPLVGRWIVSTWFDERVAPPDLADVLTGAEICGVIRRGKVMLVETDRAVLGVHFGMTGRVEIDGGAPIERLEYASGADRPEWDRLRLHAGTSPTAVASEVPSLRMNDPRRLGRLSIDPDLSNLGPEADSLDATTLAARLRRRSGAIKSVLLDQSVVAGLGNLCADEVLFSAGVAPARRVDTLDIAELEQIAAACRERLPSMLQAGGSTGGTLDPERRAGLGPCPLDGGELMRTKISGRTAVWCHRHQG